MITILAPASGPEEASWELPADPEFVAKVRQMVGETLTGWRMPELIENVTLIVSELYTNALLYAEPPIKLVLRAEDTALYGGVEDHGELCSYPETGGIDDEHGRGLLIVTALCAEWGIVPLTEGRGKRTWFRCAKEAKADDARP